MGIARSSFPETIWNGLSRNPDRTNKTNNVNPNFQDWDKIVSEVIAIEEFLFSIDSGNDLYNKIANEPIDQGQLVSIANNGNLELADNINGNISGIAVTSGVSGEEIAYIRRGRVVMANWFSIIGSVELVPGANYFLNSDGLFSETAPENGFIITIGEAQTKEILDFEIGVSIKL